MEIRKTYREIIELEAACGGYLERIGKAETELSAEVKRFLKKQIAPIKEEFQEEVYLNKIRCAHKDTKGVLIRDQHGDFQFTEEGEVKRISLNKTLMSKEVAIHSRFIEVIPTDLTEDEADLFEGIFWPENNN